MKYKFQWNYKSSLGGPWLKGDVVDLSEAQAEAIQKDSPGVLKATKQPASHDRMQAEAEFERKSVQRVPGEAMTRDNFFAVIDKADESVPSAEED